MDVRQQSALQRRVLDKVLPREDGCWLWCGAIRTQGYGAMKLAGKVVDAHRVAWLAWKGEIPEGLQVCRTCHTPLCVNPAHLVVLTHQGNVSLAIADGRRTPYVTTRRLTDGEEAMIIDRLRSGETQAAVRKRFQIAISTLHRLMVRYGLRAAAEWMSAKH